MINTYGLNEVWVPEDKDLDEEYRHLPRCNIFMTPDFRDDTKEPQNEKALVLI
jgi:hypothetical protein